MIYIQSAFSQEEQRLELVGRQGEGGTRQIVFDCADVLAEYPDALIVCAMQRAGDHKAYLKDCAADGANRAVTLESADVAVPGILKIELRALIGDDVRKSAVYIAKVAESLRGEQDRPGSPAADLLNRLDATLERAENSVSAADQAAKAAQEIAETVREKLENGELNGAKGDKGDPGDVQDVQVAGVSVLQDGVANVPIATEDAPGVVSVLTPQDSGIWNDKGSLKISYATDEEISSRTGKRKALVCANMDYAVKAAMCDGKGAAWTEAEQKAARERIGAVGFDNGSESANLYDPSIQTAETVAPHYYVNGVPYTTTQYDTMWNCTAPISVSPNTTYTVGLVPAYHYVYASEDIMIVKPWSHAGSGVQFYDASGTWIRSTSLNTFTTPANCVSMRFNYIKGKRVNLATLAERCMLVKGDTLPTTYEAYGTNDTTGIAYALKKNGVPHYEYRNNVLTVYQNGTKIVYGYSGNNNLMMCKGYGLVDAFVPFTTDILSPMIITASENADGDLDDSYRLTGGNHSYGQTSGAPSANTILVKIIADGKEAKTSGLFNTLILHARHEIQAWNTEKADGTGRSVIVEDDYIIWDGQRMNVEIHLTPTEKVVISEYYGLQLAEINSCNVYGDKIKKNIATGGYSDEVPYYIEGVCEKFRIRMHLDDVGLGKYTYNTTAVKYSKNDYKKAYFRPIGEGHAFDVEDYLWLRGYFEISAS